MQQVSWNLSDLKNIWKNDTYWFYIIYSLIDSGTLIIGELRAWIMDDDTTSDYWNKNDDF